MKYFGTNGIRKTSSYFTQDFLENVCAAVIALQKRPLVVIARDPRESGEAIERIVIDCFVRAGSKVVSLGMTATPVLAYCAKLLVADCAIMVSASHNPPQYNGIKFFDGEGRKISETVEKKLEELIDARPRLPRAKGGTLELMDGDKAYIERFSALLKPLILPKKVLLDTANGAMSNVAPRLFEALGCRPHTIFSDTSGKSINKECGATAPKAFLDKMPDYDIGYCFDGDGDRMLACCDGKRLDGDHIMYIIARHLDDCGALDSKILVGTIMSNRGVEEAAQRAGFTFFRTKVGDKHVAAEMKRLGASIGGEASGHIIVGRYQNTGDGLLAAAMLTAATSNKKLADCDDIEDYPQAEGDILTTFERVAAYKKLQKEIDLQLDDIRTQGWGRLVVRPSGTEPKIRIMAEAATPTKAYAMVAMARARILRRLANVK